MSQQLVPLVSDNKTDLSRVLDSQPSDDTLSDAKSRRREQVRRAQR